jgi:hypothetical protein
VAGQSFAVTGHAALTWNLPNDQLLSAVTITVPPVSSVSGVNVNGSNVSATKEAGEPHHCGDQFSTASVWYRWTPTTSRSIRLKAGGTQLLCVAVYRAPSTVASPSFGQLTAEAAGADDQGYPIDFTFTASTANTYWIAVDGLSVEQNRTPNGQCFYTTPTGMFLLNLS